MTQLTASGNASTEGVLFEAHPAMFRNKPLMFILFCMMIPAFGIGLVFLLIWWLDTLGTTLTVTNKRTTLRHGLLSKHTNDVFHKDVRNVQISQSIFQRLFGVGNIGISSSGQSGIEIVVAGIVKPERIKEFIDQGREGLLTAPPRATLADSGGSGDISSPVTVDDSLSPAAPKKPSYFASSEFREAAQGWLDRLAYAASFQWVARMPDWAQPIVWGLLGSIPFVVIVVTVIRAMR